MISRTAEYAIRATLWLADRLARAHTVREIARATDVPSGYLAKILQALGRAGIVRAQPGPGGGFVMVRSPGHIRVIDVIDAVGPLRRIGHCPLREPHQGGLCPLHERLDQAVAAVQAVFGRCTLEQLLAESRDRGLCCAPAEAVPNAHPTPPSARSGASPNGDGPFDGTVPSPGDREKGLRS